MRQVNECGLLSEGSAGDHLPRSMDPNYSTGTGPYPWDRPAPAPSSTRSRPSTVSADSGWVQQLRDEQAAQFRAEVLRRLCLMPSGQRIRNLRAILGWTQRMAATQLGVSGRTLIRHERGHHRTPWLRHSLLQRLREVESDHAEELIAHLARG